MAPHKAILLISVMDLIEKGIITEPSFPFSDSLESQFKENWSHYLKNNQLFKPVASTPFWHMQSESFWKISYIINSEMGSISSTPSGTQLKRLKANATIDESIFQLMRVSEHRSSLKQFFVEYYLDKLTLC